MFTDKKHEQVASFGEGLIEVWIVKDTTHDQDPKCHLVIEGSESRRLQCSSFADARSKAKEFVAATMIGLNSTVCEFLNERIVR